ncbi:hypothetical protein MTO96_038449 [Rhipicephalus appendiculatus]
MLAHEHSDYLAVECASHPPSSLTAVSLPGGCNPANKRSLSGSLPASRDDIERMARFSSHPPLRPASIGCWGRARAVANHQRRPMHGEWDYGREERDERIAATHSNLSPAGSSLGPFSESYL